MKENNWEIISEEGDWIYTKRLKVNGGFLYRVIGIEDDAGSAIALAFVPDVDLQRYQAHLRDAYNQGFKDGMEEGKAHV